MKPDRILAENIVALLVREHLSQHDLAQWCRHSDVWVSDFLRGKRSWRIEDLGRAADLFGLQAYQLFIPGVALRTERRAGPDRRTIKDRRVGQAVPDHHRAAVPRR